MADKFKDDEFKEYEQMKAQGADAKSAYLHAEECGFDRFAQIRMLRKVYGLSLIDAKEVIMCHETGAKYLSEYQEKIVLPMLEELFEVWNPDDPFDGDKDQKENQT